MPLSAAMRLARGLALMRAPGMGVEATFLGASEAAPVCAGDTGASGFGAGVSGAGLGAAAGAVSTALVSSPSSTSTAITALTATPSVPSATRSLATTPSSTASTSMVALSVSISAIRSPELTSSPSLTSHLASVPSSMVGLSAGIVMLIGIAYIPSQTALAAATTSSAFGRLSASRFPA